jgi:hypothetical protein
MAPLLAATDILFRYTRRVAGGSSLPSARPQRYNRRRSNGEAGLPVNIEASMLAKPASFWKLVLTGFRIEPILSDPGEGLTTILAGKGRNQGLNTTAAASSGLIIDVCLPHYTFPARCGKTSFLKKAVKQAKP